MNTITLTSGQDQDSSMAFTLEQEEELVLGPGVSLTIPKGSWVRTRAGNLQHLAVGGFSWDRREPPLRDTETDHIMAKLQPPAPPGLTPAQMVDALAQLPPSELDKLPLEWLGLIPIWVRNPVDHPNWDSEPHVPRQTKVASNVEVDTEGAEMLARHGYRRAWILS